MAIDRRIRVAPFLQREIAIAVHGMRDPRLGMVTITRVTLNEDMSVATAHWTVLGDLKQRSLSGKALASATSMIVASYAKSLHMRILPQLRFAYDDDEEKRHRMDDLIRQARTTDTDGGAQPEPPVEAPLNPTRGASPHSPPSI